MRELGFTQLSEAELHSVSGSGFWGEVGKIVLEEAGRRLIDYAKDPYVIDSGCPDHGPNGPC